MNVSIKVTDIIVDAQIQQWEFSNGKKSDVNAELCISTCDGNYIFIKFASPEMLQDFCKKHNFPLEDKRNAN
jgi:hypothetical protein